MRLPSIAYSFMASTVSAAGSATARPGAVITNASSSRNIFCYGTLMAPEVMQGLLGRIPPYYRYAQLHGYVRHPVERFVFPAMIPTTKTTRQSPQKQEEAAAAKEENDNNNHEEEHMVEGVVYTDLSEAEVRRLDYFEDVEYRRIPVQVRVLDGPPIAAPMSANVDAATNQEVPPSFSQQQPQQQERLVLSTSSSWIVLATEAYVWVNPTTELDLTKDWSYETFRQTNLSQYLERTVRPCRVKLDEMGW